jgi:hypothetical protein
MLDRLETTVALTFDVDWAPDWCIELCAELCAHAKVPATFFITHASPALGALRQQPLVELGLHPNFLPGSSHGETPGAVLDHCLALVPEASAMRMHGLFQSSALMALVADRYPAIETDVSLLLPFHRNLEPTDLYMGASRRRLTRLPYCWEDDVAATWPGWRWETDPIISPGLAIFAFHPIHVALNMTTLARYDALKRALAVKPLAEASRTDVAPFADQGPGARDFLVRLLALTDRRRFRRISEITRAHRRRST